MREAIHMIFPEVKSMISPDLQVGVMPADPDDCAILIEMEIGPKGLEGGDLFQFVAVTPANLSKETEWRWGRGYLVLHSFSWTAIEDAVAKLLTRAARPSWSEVASELAKELQWEFDNYRE